MKNGRLLSHAAFFTIINLIVSEASASLPSNSLLIVIFAVSQLKRFRLAVIPKPNQEILLMRKKPAARRFARNLLSISDFSEHFEDA